MCMKCMYGELWHDALVAAGNSVMQIWIMRFCNYSCIGTSARVFNEILHSFVSWRKKEKGKCEEKKNTDRCCEKAPSEIQKKDRWQHDLATSTANKNSQVSQFSLAASYCHRLRFLIY
jgi:hypothetical protein